MDKFHDTLSCQNSYENINLNCYKSSNHLWLISRTNLNIRRVEQEAVTMMLQYQLHKILLVAATMIMITSAMKCDKLILTSGSVGNTGATSTTHLILETGQYLVTTTLYTRSSKIQKFIKRLNGASDIQYSAKSFTATLVPKDLKKVCH